VVVIGSSFIGMEVAASLVGTLSLIKSNNLNHLRSFIMIVKNKKLFYFFNFQSLTYDTNKV
jgi:hypothetical protein